MPVLQSEAQAEQGWAVTLGMKAEELKLQGCQHEELSEALPGAWVSLWHGDNSAGSDYGADLGLAMHMLQSHTLGSRVIQNLPFGFLSLHSVTAFPSLAQCAENVCSDI